MSLVRPRAWRPGDRIAVVAPASPFSREEFDRGCAELRRLGFDPVFDDDVFARSWYVAGSAGLRAAAIQRALADPSIAGLIAVRGGFGSMHVLPAMDAATWRAAGKALVGYSDLTSLFAWQTCHVGMVAIHGPMLAGRLSEGEAKYDADSFLRVVGDPTPFGMVPGGGLLTLRAGEATGPLFGAPSRSCARRWRRRTRSIPRPDASSSSRMSANGPTASIACSRNSCMPASSAAPAGSCSARWSSATSLAAPR